MLDRANKISFVFLFGLAMLFSANGIMENWNYIFPVYSVSKVEVITPVITEGEHVVIRATVTRREICSPKVVRIFRDINLDKIVKVGESPGAIGGIGKNIVPTFAVAGTNDLSPGSYRVSGYVSNDCGSRIYTVPSPEYSFTVKGR